MEIEFELESSENDHIQVLQKVTELAKKAKELGFSIKEIQIESEDEDEEEEEE